MDNNTWWEKCGWREDPDPYWDGVTTSEKVLRQIGMYRSVRRGMKKISNRTGKPYGSVMMCYEVEFIDEEGMWADVWQLESSHPTYESAKKYMGWK